MFNHSSCIKCLIRKEMFLSCNVLSASFIYNVPNIRNISNKFVIIVVSPMVPDQMNIFPRQLNFKYSLLWIILDQNRKKKI